MSREAGFVYTVHMLHEILNLGTILIGQTIARGIRNIDHRGTSLDDSFHHTSQIFIIGAACILCVELYVLHILLGIFYSSHCTLNNFFAIGIKLIFDVAVTCTNTRMNTLMLRILQSLSCTVYIFLHCTCQSTNSRPCHSLGYLHHGIEVAWTGNRETCLYDINPQLFQLLSHLDFLNSIQLTARNLLAITKSCVENK